MKPMLKVLVSGAPAGGRSLSRLERGAACWVVALVSVAAVSLRGPAAQAAVEANPRQSVAAVKSPAVQASAAQQSVVIPSAFIGPTGDAVDGSGNVYAADPFTGRVMEFPLSERETPV